MKKKLLFILIFLVVCFVGVGLSLSSPIILQYGVAPVQYDEQTDTYFVEIIKRYKVKPTAETKVGMQVSYYRTNNSELSVSSKLETKEEILAREKSEDNRLIAFCCFFFLCIWGVFLWIDSCSSRKQRTINASDTTEKGTD